MTEETLRQLLARVHERLSGSSTIDPEARDMLADCAHILTTIGRSLIARGSRYAAVLQALIVIAGESPIDVAKVPPVKERTEALDRDWAEEPAFAGAPTMTGPSTGTSAV